ncbi:cellulose biosynthesis cyclic di-GMP-binding regulatory protein BcsB [Escherichia coli]|nr:cellulose biosynthesis cyclic di-GMP-binding regulatory protein BcsB [Escherichia coli]
MIWILITATPMPPVKDSSRMDISLNNQFLQSFNLSSKQEANRLLLRIPVLQGLLDGKNGCLYSGAETGRDQPVAVRL